MIIVETGRGLGNSMFVYAAAKALAEHHKTELKLDTSHLRSWPRLEKFGGDWEPEIKRFNISAAEATEKEKRKFVIKTKFRPIDKLIRKYRLFERDVYRFPTSGSIEDFFNLSNNIYLWGYFGDEKFFKEIKDEIQNKIKVFKPKDSYRITIEKRNSKISSNEIISEIAKDISNKVSLDTPDWVVLIEIIEKETGIAVIPNNTILSVEKVKRSLSD